jgi:hypothetical protein
MQNPQSNNESRGKQKYTDAIERNLKPVPPATTQYVSPPRNGKTKDLPT